MTNTCLAPIARSIAPPTAGIASGAPVCQFARSPCCETWNAPMDDVTDRLDEYHDGVAVNDAAAARLRAILTAIAARDRQRAMRST